ncbi:MAG: heat shock protein HspQ [Gammaproteobacteria bacterium]|nr:heat shock protein HspQ [Gammaproteobacteria bacterium]
MTKPKFFVGQIVHHNRFDYRGVVVDVDASFQGSESWYEQVARSRPPKDQPWYRVLVDGGEHETYVAERHLEADADLSPVTHPAISSRFLRYEGGVYHRQLHS